MATVQGNSLERRKSTETEHRHLLSDSVAPSESASMIADYDDGDRTPRARSPSRAASTMTPRSYKGFASEAEYFAALEEWAESKKFLETDKRLIGFYGPKTMDDYANQPGVEFGLRKKLKARKQRKAEQQSQRRNTVA